MIDPTEFKLKLKVNKFTITELYSYLCSSLNHLTDDATEIFIKKELRQLAAKIYNKLKLHNNTRSITLNYFQIVALNYVFTNFGTKEDNINYTSVIQLISEVNSKIEL